MLTAMLWIALTALTVFLAVIASPIRFSGKAAYREGERDENEHYTKFSALVYYLHPLVLSVEYSSAAKRARLVILGFKKHIGSADHKNITPQNTDGEAIYTNGINAHDTNTNGANANTTNTDGINNADTAADQDANQKNTQDNAADGINTDGIDTTGKERPALMSRIRNGINRIKRNRAYRILRDKPLRKKLTRWLKRTAVCALRTVSFKRLKLHARVGMRYPALLGGIYGYFSAVKSALALRKRSGVDLTMEPVFTERRLCIDSEVEAKTSLSEALWLLAVALGTFPYWRTYRAVRGKK